MARPVSDRTPAPLLLGGPVGTPPGGGALLGLRSLLQGTSKPKEPASCLLKEKERKAALPTATTPGPGLETAGPADAPAAPSRAGGGAGEREGADGRGAWKGGRRREAGVSTRHVLFPQGLTSRDTPSPVDPDTVEVLMTFEPDPADLALSSIPGHETFDPRRHRFSEEELKPQPIMKKARKIQVPEEQKDEKYWSRRYKNNEAAKRSRDARRLKENQISVRAAFLEKENALLRQEVVAVRQELSHYRAVLSRYQAQHGAL
ncbi:PREDICTED: D site-binding protein [Colobus angolensis palliatus]|uniref:D site-binding protein n=1 Tax=Colobus angolensis palliatus TaxID=336983 RepID=UPI0005F53169|nr:PREDICTED: D site-binding protein [Colobus angolensis palliatus]